MPAVDHLAQTDLRMIHFHLIVIICLSMNTFTVINTDKAIELKLMAVPLAPMGVLAPRSAHARPSAQPPIDTS